MSTMPGHDPLDPQDANPQNDVATSSAGTLLPDSALSDAGASELEPAPWTIEQADDLQPAAPPTAERLPEAEPSLLFQSFSRADLQPPPRIPHLGHLGLLAALAFVSLLGVGLLVRVGLHFRLFGVSKATAAVSEIHYMLGSMGVLYALTFVLSLLVFPLFWQKSLFAGLQWRAQTALHLRRRLFGAACFCFVLALVNGAVMPGPPDTPIDKIFRTPGAAWLLFFFGVTFAPFFEEILFRGFLLPALCTAYDWTAEWISGEPSPGSDENGHPLWSVPAMVAASILTSVPFALMHGEQTSYAAGPLLLLVCVSLVLCWARLSTRSLAASVLVHASYNFLLFFLMLLGTSGFRHLDKM